MFDSLVAFPGRYFGAWHGDALSAFEAILAPSFTWTDPSLPEPLTALDGVGDFFGRSKQSFPDLHFEVIGEPLVDAGGSRVAAMWRMTGTHQAEGLPPQVPATGKGIDVVGTDVFTLDADGRATGITACYDAMTLAGQLGLMG